MELPRCLGRHSGWLPGTGHVPSALSAVGHLSHPLSVSMTDSQLKDQVTKVSPPQGSSIPKVILNLYTRYKFLRKLNIQISNLHWILPIERISGLLFFLFGIISCT